MSRLPAPRILAASFVALLFTALPGLAQTTYTWTGASPTNSWSEPLNWSVTAGTGNPPPPSDLDNTLLVLTGNAQATNVLDQNLSANRLTFDANAAAFTVGGSSTLTIGTGGIAIDSNNNQTLNATLAAGSATGWVNNGTGVFTVNGAVNTGAFQVSVGGAGNSVYSGAITGTAGLNKLGNGTVTLLGNNTLTGQSNVLSGVLEVGAGGTLSGPPETASVGVVGTGTLSIASAGSVSTPVVVLGASARIEGTGTANIVSLGAIDGNGEAAGNISGGVNGVGTLTVSDLIFGTGATQRIRITSAGTPAAVNTGGSSGGSSGNPANNNYLRVTGSLYTNSLLFGAPEEFETYRFVIDGTGTAFSPGESYSYGVGQVDFNLLGVLLGDVTIGAGLGGQAQFSTIGLANASDFSWTLTQEGTVFLNFTVSPVSEPATVLVLAAGALGLGNLARRRLRRAIPISYAARHSS